MAKSWDNCHQVVGLLSWVLPRPTPAQKLRRVGWDEEHKPELSLQHLRDLSRREKKVVIVNTQPTKVTCCSYACMCMVDNIATCTLPVEFIMNRSFSASLQPRSL